LKKKLVYGVVIMLVGLATVLAVTKKDTTEVASVELVSSEVQSPKQEQPTVKNEILNVQKVTVSSSNIVLLNVGIFEESVAAAIEMLDNAGGETIYLVLNSPGGSVLAGAKLIDYIKHSGKNIVTVCDNICASMAFQIFEQGKKRLMTSKAMLMAHPASGGAQGTIENMATMINAFRLYVDRMDAAVASRSNIPYDKFKAMVADNIWVETPEALKLNLADGVVHLKTKSLLGMDAHNNVLEYLKATGQYTEEKQKIRGYVMGL
jgi:ATP-dependent Clp protease, protease subunit